MWKRWVFAIHLLRSKLQSSKWFKDVQIQRTSIIGCIYKHPKLPIEEFYYQFLSPILEKFFFENKDIYLLGDFNINLLNYESDRHTAHFLDDMYSNSFNPYIMLPTRNTPRYKTLIDNIFYNNFNESIISWNLVTVISDHLAQIYNCSST